MQRIRILPLFLLIYLGGACSGEMPREDRPPEAEAATAGETPVAVRVTLRWGEK